MTVPPWEFYDRVLGRTVLGDDRDSARLRSVAGAVAWREWSPSGDESFEIRLLDLAADAGVTLSEAVASNRLLHELGLLRWRDGAVERTSPDGTPACG